MTRNEALMRISNLSLERRVVATLIIDNKSVRVLDIYTLTSFSAGMVGTLIKMMKRKGINVINREGEYKVILDD